MPDTATSSLASPGPWHIMRPVRGQIRLAMALSVCSVVLGLASLALMALVVQALVQTPAGSALAWPWPLMAAALLCTVGAYALRLSAFNQSHYAAFALEVKLRTQLSEHLAQTSLGTLSQLGAGALAKVMQDDVKALHVFVADSTPLYARAYAAPALTFALLLWLDWRLALAAAAVLVGGMAVMRVALRGHGALNQRYNQAREQVHSAVIEFVQAMPVVRTFDGGQASFGRYQRALEAYRDVLAAWYRSAGFTARFSMAVLNPLPTLLLLLWLGAYWFAHDALAFPVWLAVLLLGTGMAEAFMPVMSLFHMVAKAKVSIERIQQVLRVPVLAPPAPGTQHSPADASVRFDNVGFRYDERTADALQGVDFVVPAGSVTALVGPSGAGKTTVARLIPRFWDVASGAIRIGGVDVRAMAPEVLMQQVAFVFQDSFLFHDSIANNIRLGLPDASLAQVVAAATAAQAHEFILQLPQGYDTPAGERGVFLSGGQRQRITIARAILQNRPILVLDEATAFADPENEAALVAALAQLMRGKTVIMVAHRLSTIRDADQILVFDQGRLAERGRHEALLARQGVYARLWHSYEQAQGWTLQASTPLNAAAPVAAPLAAAL